jgi:hypothetical protein
VNRVIEDRYDIAVIGAGPAGITAAAAAADRGVKVILIEIGPGLGGSVTAALHRCICGLYSQAPKNPLDTLNGDAQRRIVELMVQKEPAAVRTRQFGKAWVLEFPGTAWQHALSSVAANANIHLCLNTRVSAIARDQNRIESIQLDSPAGKSVEIAALIDCTGGGNILRLAGADAYQQPDDPADRMLAGYSMRLTALAGDPEILRLQIPYLLARAVEKGALPPIARFTGFHPGPGQNEGVCKLAIDLVKFTSAQAESFATDVFDYLKKESAAFTGARIVETSPHILPRDGLRLRGKYILTEADVLSAKKHDGGSVHAWWSIERWNITTGPTYDYPPPGDFYDIPHTALQSAAIENLFAAGTCLSATAAAAASSRVSGICLATGHAAGMLALSNSDTHRMT